MSSKSRACRSELAPAPAGKQWKYWIGFYCPHDHLLNEHFELCNDPDYDAMCESRGRAIYLDVDPNDSDLPVGEWRLVPESR